MKEKYLIWLKYVPVFVLMLFLSFPLVSHAQIEFVRSASVSIPNHTGVFVGDEVVDEFRVNGFFTCERAGNYSFLARLGSISYVYDSGYGSQDAYVTDLRLVVNGEEFPASYVYDPDSGLGNIVFQATTYFQAGGIHYNFVGNLHRRISGTLHSSFGNDSYLYGTYAGTYGGTMSNVQSGNYSGQISGDGNIYTETTITGDGTLNIAESQYENGFVFLSSGITVSDSATQDLLRAQTEQQKKDAQASLDESKKQTNALTEFAKADEMAKNSLKNGTTLGDYSSHEDSAVADAKIGLDKFDFLYPLKFAEGVSQAVLLCSTWLTGIITGMSGFAYIFTLGAALSLGLIFIGLWRFKRG